MARKRSKKWMQSSVKRPGAFRRWCRSRGYKGVTKSCIAEGLRSKNTRVKRMAVLARTFRKYGGRKKRR